MNPDRRQILKGGAVAALGVGFMTRLDRVAAKQRMASLTEIVDEVRGGSAKLLLGPKEGEEGPPEPASRFGPQPGALQARVDEAAQPRAIAGGEAERRHV